MCLHHKKGWNLANSLAPCNMVFIAQMSCFLEYVNSFNSGHKFRTHICTVRSSFFYVGSWKLWDVSCYNVNHIWIQNFLNGKSTLAGQKGQSILHFPCSTPFCAELCTQSFQSILKRVLARMDEFDKCAIPPGHFCLNISLCVWAVVHKNVCMWTMCMDVLATWQKLLCGQCLDHYRIWTAKVYFALNML